MFIIKIKDIESLLLNFRIISRKQYLAILHTGCKMVIIKVVKSPLLKFTMIIRI